MKQTAVEWLVQQITDGTIPAREAIQQAKEMEKEQIIEANENKMPFITGEEYYNETFKS